MQECHRNFIQHSRYVALLLTAAPTAEIYTLSLHDALPIFFTAQPMIVCVSSDGSSVPFVSRSTITPSKLTGPDRKSTRLNSSHSQISYAVFCLIKKTSFP